MLWRPQPQSQSQRQGGGCTRVTGTLASLAYLAPATTKFLPHRGQSFKIFFGGILKQLIKLVGYGSSAQDSAEAQYFGGMFYSAKVAEIKDPGAAKRRFGTPL